MIVGSCWRKKKEQTKTPPKYVFLYIGASKAAGNNKSKFKNKYVCLLAVYERAKSRNDWCFRLRLYEYFLCQAFQFRERLDATTTIDSRFVQVCSCVYVNFSFMKRQQKLNLFFTLERVATKKWRSRWTGGDKEEKLVQQRVNPQKLQKFQSSRRLQQVPLRENSIRPGNILKHKNYNRDKKFENIETDLKC